MGMNLDLDAIAVLADLERSRGSDVRTSPDPEAYHVAYHAARAGYYEYDERDGFGCGFYADDDGDSVGGYGIDGDERGWGKADCELSIAGDDR